MISDSKHERQAGGEARCPWRSRERVNTEPTLLRAVLTVRGARPPLQYLRTGRAASETARESPRRHGPRKQAAKPQQRNLSGLPLRRFHSWPTTVPVVSERFVQSMGCKLKARQVEAITGKQTLQRPLHGVVLRPDASTNAATT
ncbi:hypothetical protein HPB49_000711 [Dermacentor silvarum]|uniref:Uncharacterized protein n=1 Tax=Dermacentor silvarum TaxID=543639 RepID=A0ACB8DT86_DERSI|nr:hypothetical protein HPB49_000711 [Dermacentor silvarum]